MPKQTAVARLWLGCASTPSIASITDEQPLGTSPRRSWRRGWLARQSVARHRDRAGAGGGVRRAPRELAAAQDHRYRQCPRVALAKQVAWEELTAGAMADRWADYLAKTAGAPYRPKRRLELGGAGRDADPAPHGGPSLGENGGATRRWKVGATTCPRKRPRLLATLRSMQRAGFPAPDLYVDGPEPPRVPWGHMAATSESRLGPWRNWLRTL